jgi:DNA-binding XRE family transcriptional regulator
MTRAKAFKNLANSIKADPERAARVEAHRLAIEDALALAELRKVTGVTQQELAARLDMTQANVSRIEHERDIYLSTLRHYVEALGGELEISAVFGDHRVKLSG